MKIGVVCAANIISSPYVKYYTDILDELNINYDILIWNKLNIEENDYQSIISYNKRFDNKSSKIKKILGYYSYSRFVINNIKKNKYDKLILLTAQSGVLIYRYLEKNYLNNYILDIRDYANAKYYMKILTKLVKNSYMTSISSNGFLKWLPKSKKYIKSHNTSSAYINNFVDEVGFKDMPIKVSTIGQIRDYESNKNVIDIFKNNKSFEMNFIGKGSSENDLKLYCDSNNIQNVEFKGRYKKEEEKYHYIHSDLINICVGHVAEETGVLANRLYNAVIYGKPIIIERGSYMSKLVENYNLGVSINIKEPDILQVISKYIANFNPIEFNRGRREFLKNVKKDMNKFENSVKLFINS